MAGGEFDKDFGYLMPFLDKVSEAASRETDAATRAELLELVGGQRQRWARIRELLSGSAGASPAGAQSKAAPPARNQAGSLAGEAMSKRMAETRAARQSFTGTEGRSFTVGSLRPRAR
ncbi:MAG TPA: hypothetical protein VE262_18375 [Blastocatellia bacterium]|nr:hypothetical protein [Blastocatellia bacterium]